MGLSRPYTILDSYEYQNEAGFQTTTVFKIQVNSLTEMQASALHAHLVDETKFKCSVYGKAGGENNGTD